MCPFPGLSHRKVLEEGEFASWHENKMYLWNTGSRTRPLEVLWEAAPMGHKWKNPTPKPKRDYNAKEYFKLPKLRCTVDILKVMLPKLYLTFWKDISFRGADSLSSQESEQHTFRKTGASGTRDEPLRSYMNDHGSIHPRYLRYWSFHSLTVSWRLPLSSAKS